MESNTNNLNTNRRSAFNYNYHFSETHSSKSMPEYVRHNMDIYNKVDGLSAVYQNGQRHYHGNLATPSIEYELSEYGGTDKVLIAVNKLSAVQINALSDADVEEFITEIDYDGFNTKADILSLHSALMENNAAVSEYAEKAEANALEKLNEYTTKESNKDYEA